MRFENDSIAYELIGKTFPSISAVFRKKKLKMESGAEVLNVPGIREDLFFGHANNIFVT
jgi:hypothetical protein